MAQDTPTGAQSTRSSLLKRLGDYRGGDDDDDDPMLVTRDGNPVGTWREGGPHPGRMGRAHFDPAERARVLVGCGIPVVKFWFSVSRREQRARFVSRQVDPVRQWKLSPTDLASLDRWDDYTDAKEAMFFYTDAADAPWTVIKSNDKKRARLQAMRYLLTRFEYEKKDDEVVGKTDPLLVGRASQLFEDDERPTRQFPQL